MITVPLIEEGIDRFIEYPCRCGCGKLIKLKLKKYASTKCYGVQLSRDNQKRKKEKKD